MLTKYTYVNDLFGLKYKIDTVRIRSRLIIKLLEQPELAKYTLPIVFFLRNPFKFLAFMVGD